MRALAVVALALLAAVAITGAASANDFPSESGQIVTAADLNRLVTRLGCPEIVFYPMMSLTHSLTKRVLQCQAQHHADASATPDPAADKFVDDLLRYRFLP